MVKTLLESLDGTHRREVKVGSYGRLRGDYSMHETRQVHAVEQTAETSRQSDIPSSQLLYRLVPSERPTEEQGMVYCQPFRRRD
ncbi:MAG: hypothetical protein ACLTZT_00080 [Butyricimonas faecalis]